MSSDSTLIGRAAARTAAAPSVTGAARSPAAATAVDRSDTAARVAALITRRARVAGLSDAAYFAEIIAGRAPRITRAEAASEPLPSNPRRRNAIGDATGADGTITLH